MHPESHRACERALVRMYGAFVEGATTDLMLPKRAGQKRQLDQPSFFNPLFQRHNAVVGAVKGFFNFKKII